MTKAVYKVRCSYADAKNTNVYALAETEDEAKAWAKKLLIEDRFLPKVKVYDAVKVLHRVDTGSFS